MQKLFFFCLQRTLTRRDTDNELHCTISDIVLLIVWWHHTGLQGSGSTASAGHRVGGGGAGGGTLRIYRTLIRGLPREMTAADIRAISPVCVCEMYLNLPGLIPRWTCLMEPGAPQIKRFHTHALIRSSPFSRINALNPFHRQRCIHSRFAFLLHYGVGWKLVFCCLLVDRGVTVGLSGSQWDYSRLTLDPIGPALAGQKPILKVSWQHE